ncbi:SAM hydrolase/SAM-dependent halogenase family protein [Reichenbachiella versicolor]|uniref:SAM hydrolase/SAM-dependent halogenase family protein n=1 Tax=Reichenbachiella versicolor TaxID=1821036 RepID=UPI000D6DF040|nr:SAM-dependent chlorinase/fluorinase [Reichenbachiella versicolor]
MTIVTFLSDFGIVDHYVAAVKAQILSVNREVTIVDISHSVKVGDIGHAAYLLKEVFRDFPEGTVHIVGISNSSSPKTRCIALKLEGHFFVGEDSGLFSLLSDIMPHAVVELNEDSSIQTTFPAKDIMARAAAKLATGIDIQAIGQSIDDIQRFMPTQAKATKQQIAGNIIRVDHYGNLITNILKRDFDAIMKINNYSPYEVNFRREKITKLNNGFSDVAPGECYVLFNSSDKLQIGINQGRGSDLLGLGMNDQVFIDFKI